jgi:hypothetical protein
MSSTSFGLLTFIALILVALLTVWLAIAGPLTDALMKATLGEWLGFMGAVVGSLATPAAAAIAWFAVQRQITNEAAIATAQQREVFQALDDETREFFEHVELVWRAIDLALEPHLDPEKRRQSLWRSRQFRLAGRLD